MQELQTTEQIFIANGINIPTIAERQFSNSASAEAPTSRWQEETAFIKGCFYYHGLSGSTDSYFESPLGKR